jgi:conjugal transfer pilus assembly protein TraB
VGGERKASTKTEDAKKEKPAAYVPSGSNFEAVLLNGMDASTSIGANRSPTPALLRVKTDAILPNLFSFNVRECFILVGGFGNMSSERVEMRTETMSCIAESGEVYEGKIEGYLVGEDGKAGARGRVVSKQGALLAKSFMAGFVGGLGGAFAPQPVQSLSLSGGSTQQYQLPNPDQVLGSGLATGLNRSSQALANFYIKLAEQMFPVVELDAGRKMTIILLKGVELKMDKKG